MTARKVKAQLEFILKVTRRYKENGGFIYDASGEKPVRVSLADFVLREVGACITPHAKKKGKANG